MKYERTVYGNMELIGNICVWEKMRIAEVVVSFCYTKLYTMGQKSRTYITQSITKSTLFDGNIMRNAENDHHEHICTDPCSRACCGTLDGELQLKYFRFLRWCTFWRHQQVVSSFKNPHKKKSQGVRSGLWRYNSLEMIRSLKIVFRYSIIVCAMQIHSSARNRVNFC